LYLNLGGSGDFLNFFIPRYPLFWYLIDFVCASWLKKQANCPLLIENKTRSAAREERETRKITPVRFLVGSLPNPPLQTPCWAAGGLKITNCDLQFVAHCSFCGGNTFWREMALFGAKKHENVKKCKITNLHYHRLFNHTVRLT
jgi:hypothetical protein